MRKIDKEKYKDLSFKELDKKKNKLSNKIDQLWNKYCEKGTWDGYCKECEPYWNDYDDVLCHWILKHPLNKVSTRPVSECHGQLYTIKEFKACCVSGLFIESDGDGYYVKDKKEYEISARPSFFVNGIIRPDFTHVMWYNK